VSGLAELIRAFRARSPAVEVDLRELTLQEQVEALRARRIDLGFVRGPLREPDLSLRLVRSEPLLLALPTGHPLARRARLSLTELADEPFVTFPRERGPAFFDQIMRLCHDAGFTPRIVQQAMQLDVVSLVAAGFGVAILPGSMRLARRPGAVFRAIEGAPTTDLLAAWRPDDDSPVLRDFLDVLGEVGVRGQARAKSARKAARSTATHPSTSTTRKR
jgi:DNA-binding transcriptional LysR family regulator